ncbi:NAD-dependent epimerase/dehydratase family protein [Helicobacter fennelliae]
MRASALHSPKLKILLTGASGFIGQQVLRYLLSQNHQVLCPTRNPHKLKSFHHKNCIIKHTDIYTQNLDFMQGYDTLIHLAWESMNNVCDYKHIDINYAHSMHLIKQAITSYKIKNITIAGSCFEYGTHSGKINESFIPNPQTSYGIAKTFLHKSLEQFQKIYPFQLKWLRIFYLYGEGQNPHSLLPQLQNALNHKQTNFNMSGGEQLRDYLDIKIAASYIAKIALHQDFNGVCNICSGSPISVRMLCERYLHNTQQSINLNLGFYPYAEYEPLAYWGDNTKLLKLLGGGGIERNKTLHNQKNPKTQPLKFSFIILDSRCHKHSTKCNQTLESKLDSPKSLEVA